MRHRQRIRWGFAALAFGWVAAASAGELRLAVDGRSDYVIFLADDASPPERTAAGELREHLAQITGARLRIGGEADTPPEAPQILVGQSARAIQRFPGIDWAGLGLDGIVIKTSGPHLLLAGGRPRGTLYAIYTFLEETVGCRWWTSSEGFLPRRSTLAIPDLNITYLPPLRYREAFYRDVNHNPVFAARLRSNGHFAAIAPEYGGHYTILGWCHTFYSLLPPDQYFEKHPDWYSFSRAAGRRIRDGAQLCLTNDEMRKRITEAALERIKEAPEAGMISISQNDCAGACECDNCQAVEKAEGAPSGPLLRFVNAVAADIEKEHPGFLIETLAYQYTRQPPRSVRPRANVVVRLCSIECDFFRPLGSEANASFRDQIARWSEIAPHLYIWNYVTNFRHYLLPHPNMRSLADDLRFLVRHKAIGMFEQGDAESGIGDFVALRAWLLAHLLWDPSRDEKALTKEFLDGYYGAAAPHLAAYLALVEEAFSRTNRRLPCFHTYVDYLTPQDLRTAAGLFEQAARAAAGDETLARRVRRERLPLDHLRLLRFPEDTLGARLRGEPAPTFDGGDWIRACEDFIDTARRFGVGSYREGGAFASYEPTLRELCRPAGPPPEACRGLADTRWIDVQDNMFTLYNVGAWVSIVDDPAASDGKAARMPGNHVEWAVQWPVVPVVARTAPKWRCHVTVRCEARAAAGAAFTVGLYDAENRTTVATQTAPVEKCPPGGYLDCDLGVQELREGMFFWAAPADKTGTISAIWVDRIYLVRADN